MIKRKSLLDMIEHKSLFDMIEHKSLLEMIKHKSLLLRKDTNKGGGIMERWLFGG